MMRNPTFHYDFLMGTPGGPVFQTMVERQFSEFTDADLIGGMIPQFLNELDDTTRMSSYMLQLYRRFGQHTFVVGPKVQELFRRTRLAKITPEMILPPVPAFYIAVADCPWQLWGGERTKFHKLTGLYVSFGKVHQGKPVKGGFPVKDSPKSGLLEDCINFMLWGEANDRSLNPYDDAVMWFSISLDQWVKAGQDLETFFQQQSVMSPDVTDMAKGSPKGDPFAPAYLPKKGKDRDTQREMLMNALRLALSVCLYMGSEDPDITVKGPEERIKDLEKKISAKKSPGKRKKLERQLASLPRTRLVYVGPMFEELLGPGGRPVGRKSQDDAHASPIEHGVSPHWQRYHVGSGNRRTIKWCLKGMYLRGSGKADRTLTKFRE